VRDQVSHPYKTISKIVVLYKGILSRTDKAYFSIAVNGV
jgi:hypothetical protein